MLHFRAEQSFLWESDEPLPARAGSRLSRFPRESSSLTLQSAIVYNFKYFLHTKVKAWLLTNIYKWCKSIAVYFAYKTTLLPYIKPFIATVLLLHRKYLLLLLLLCTKIVIAKASLYHYTLV